MEDTVCHCKLVVSRYLKVAPTVRIQINATELGWSNNGRRIYKKGNTPTLRQLLLVQFLLYFIQYKSRTIEAKETATVLRYLIYAAMRFIKKKDHRFYSKTPEGHPHCPFMMFYPILNVVSHSSHNFLFADGNAARGQKLQLTSSRSLLDR